MNQGKLVFSQLMAFLPLSTFRRCVARHRGDHKVQNSEVRHLWAKKGCFGLRFGIAV